MPTLNTEADFGESGQRHLRACRAGDDFHEALIDAHRDRSDAPSEILNARLILVLADHIGDLGVLREALRIAREEV